MKNIQERNNQNPFLEGKLIFPAHLNQSEREGFFMIKMAEEKMFRTWDLVMVFLATGSFAAEKRVHKAIKIGYSERSISIFYKDAA
jgi:hypothetical protein